MDISRTRSGARLILSRQECREAGLSFESFGKDDAATGKFLAAALNLLRDRGYLCRNTDTLDIDVSETGEGLEISLSFRKGESGIRVVRFSCPESFEAALHSVTDKVSGCALWKTSEGYALIFETADQSGDPEERVIAAKIREHGKMLSCSPYELI